MLKNEIFQFVNNLNNADVPTMVFRETVFDIISFGKSSKIHLATTASLNRVKNVLSQNQITIESIENDAIKFTLDKDTVFIHSIFKCSYDDFLEKMVQTNLTFNSLLMKPNGQIYDMHEGLTHLRNKQLVFVKNFDKSTDTNLALNCIRYIYRNGFTYTEDVKKYIETTLKSFSKSERVNALFYLVEALNKNPHNETLSIILNNDFFKNEKYSNINISDYTNIIANIGKENFIYLLLVLLQVNVNKTRFSSIIDVQSFNETKEYFTANLNDENIYYSYKDKVGYEKLSEIIALQKEFSKIISVEYEEPVFHKKSIFDMLGQNFGTTSLNDDFTLSDSETTPVIATPSTKDIFSFTETPSANVNDIDFSDIFSSQEEVSVSNISDDKTEIQNEEKEETIADDFTSPIDTDISDADVIDEPQTTNIANEDEDEDEILSLLNAESDRQNKTSKRITRPQNSEIANPDKNIDSITNSACATFENKQDIDESLSTESIKETIITTENTSEDTVETEIEEEVEVEVEPVKPVELYERKEFSGKENLIDALFDEEVKPMDISLSSEFNSVISDLNSNVSSDDTPTSQRNVASETMMTDKPIAKEIPATQTQDYENFDINEGDLASILAELNGKRKNSFLDDDESSDDEIVSETNNYQPIQTYNMPSTFVPTQSQPKKSSDDDFFKALNDDFTEIVGGN